MRYTSCSNHAKAVGFLHNERLINSAKDITRVHVCDTADFVEIDTASPLNKPAIWIKTTGCGGGQTAQRFEQLQTPCLREVSLNAKAVASPLAEFMQIQDAETTSRGAYCSAISDGKNILKLAEDIGRHNTLDKLTGFILLLKPSLKPSILLTPGRVSSQMLKKSARMGVSLVILLTSPNTFTIQLAKEWGMTLIGYARGFTFQRLIPPGTFFRPGLKSHQENLHLTSGQTGLTIPHKTLK